MSLTLGLDVDGVLCDFAAGSMAHYERWFGQPQISDQQELSNWNWPWDGPTAFRNEADFWTWTDLVPQFWETLPTVPGAMGALYRFQTELGHEVRLLTSRHTDKRAATREWVRRHFPVHNVDIPIHFVKADNKGIVDAQVYIDDNPRTIESLRGRPCVIIFDQPYNRDVKSDERTHRCRGWNEVLAFLQEVDRGNDA